MTPSRARIYLENIPFVNKNIDNNIRFSNNYKWVGMIKVYSERRVTGCISYAG